ncbi:protein of unknown function [Mesotoga infera]|uniref:Uncharacterized protein n=1 Tax=Mesotoga infera TaxID=1236046 RepID=A0A7Z7LGA1_9BACT|nr:protein of unknown function [Mesotoga infera]
MKKIKRQVPRTAVPFFQYFFIIFRNSLFLLTAIYFASSLKPYSRVNESV